MHCPFYAIIFFLLEFVVAKIDDLVNWARRVSLTIIFISHTVERKGVTNLMENTVICLWLQIYVAQPVKSNITTKQIKLFESYSFIAFVELNILCEI